MKILVAVKQVAALDEDFEIRADGLDVDADFLIRDLNEWDDFSVEEAVKIKEAAGGTVEVVIVSVGPDDVDESLRKCLAKGADRAIRVWDDAVAGSDPIAIARILAAVARREAPDMLFAGRPILRSIVRLHGHCRCRLARLAACRGRSETRFQAGDKSAVFRRELEGGLLHEVEIQCPAVLTIQAGINTPRYASLRSIKQAAAKPIEVRASLIWGSMPPAMSARSGSHVARAAHVHSREGPRAAHRGRAAANRPDGSRRSSANSKGIRRERHIDRSPSSGAANCGPYRWNWSARRKRCARAGDTVAVGSWPDRPRSCSLVSAETWRASTRSSRSGGRRGIRPRHLREPRSAR